VTQRRCATAQDEATVESNSAVEDRSDHTTVLFAFMVVCLGLNLRVHLGTVPALLVDIRRDLDLGNTAFGLLTTVTVVTMGLSAPLGPILARRVGTINAVTVLMLVTGAGGLLRLFAFSTSVLFACSIVAGVGMGGTSALIPGFISRIAPRQTGAVVGLYTSSMVVGLGVAAFASHPLV
jgi:MFS transporter, CP family, cyanate transporter